MPEAAVRTKAVEAEVAEILVPRERVAEMLTIQGIDLSVQEISVKSGSGNVDGCDVGVIEVRGVSVLLSETYVTLMRNGEPIQMEPFLRSEVVGVRSKDHVWINPRFCRRCADLTGKLFSRSPVSGTQYFCQTEGCKNRWTEAP